VQDRAALRQRFKLAGKVALVEVAGLGAEATSSLAMQLSLLDGGDSITWLFDAANDVEVAAVLRRSVPALGLRAKLFGATADAALLWRAADVVVARPRPEAVARVLLVGAKLVALIDDQIAGGATAAAALEARKRGVAAKGLLLLSSALESAFGGTLPTPTADGADQVADIVAAVAADKRGVIDERRAAAHAATRDKVRAASAAASAVAATTAMPGELEDLGGPSAPPPVDVPLPDAADLARLRAEVQQRVAEATRSMMAARDAAAQLADEAKGARARGASDDAAQLDRRADSERAKMHALLGELATLEAELKELERVQRTAADAARQVPRTEAPPRSPVDDALNDLKRRTASAPPPPQGAPKQAPPKRASSVDDELAALKQKMAAKKKP
jgi:hypothetical protein